MILQKFRQSQISRNIEKSTMSQLILDDLSITSQQDDESQEEICGGQLFKCNLFKSQQFQRLYPDEFEQYPSSLVVKLSKFIKGFRHHTVAKLLHYELNCALVLHQISYKLTKIRKYYETDQSLSSSFRLLQYYLKLHSITNLCKLVQMVKILMNKKEISYKWVNQRKIPFIQLKTNHKIRIQQRDGMQLLLAIDNFTFTIVNNCSQLKYTKNYIPKNLHKINYEFFDNLPVPLQSRIKLIPKPEDIILPKIQQHFQDEELQREFHKCTKAYFNKLYKQIYLFYQSNTTDKDLNQLLFFILVAKISGDNLPFKLIEYIQKEKVKLDTTSRIIRTQNLQQFIIKSNVYFRAELPKLHLLIKNRGFIKLLSFLNESDLKDIQKEINWCYSSKRNLNSNI